MSSKLILVTGATGFIGAHVVDSLLARGLRVRAAARSAAKGEALVKARPQYQDKLEVVSVTDFEDEKSPNPFLEAVKGVDGIIHVASPFKYNITDNEKELIRPAIHGARSILQAAITEPKIKRIVLTSSFASVIDGTRPVPVTFKATDWNPITYEESIAKDVAPVVAYRGSKKFAELEAWNFIENEKPGFDLVTLCPPMVFGPIVHPVASAGQLNESNSELWATASASRARPQARVNFWVDVRNLADAHVEALLRSEAGGKRFIIASPERFSYYQAAEITAKNFPELGKKLDLSTPDPIDTDRSIDGQTAAQELGVKYTSFEKSVVDLLKQVVELPQ